jgi:hypothetical protein
MRSTKGVDLDGVVAKFEGWRKDRRLRAIPDELWDLAVGLLDEHSATDICRALGLNHSRFNEARAERVVRRRRRVAARRPRSGISRKAAEFVELMPVRLGPGGGGTLGMGVPAPGGWRLTLESGTGTLSLATRGSGPAAGCDLVGALCRFVLGSVMGDVRP